MILDILALDKMMESIGVPIDIYIIIMITIGSIILAAKNMKIGLVLTMLLYALAYTGYRMIGLDTTYALYAIFGAIVLMTLSLYTTKGTDII